MLVDGGERYFKMRRGRCKSAETRAANIPGVLGEGEKFSVVGRQVEAGG